MLNKGNDKNLFGERTRSQIEIDEKKDWHLLTKPSDNDKIARISRRSTLSNQEYEQWWWDNWFTDELKEESSELSSEPEESIRDLTSLTEIFQIIRS